MKPSCALVVVALLAASLQADELGTFYPSAIISGRDENQVVVCDARQGRLLCVDVVNKRNLFESEIGKSLVDLAQIDAERLVVIDQESRDIMIVRIDDAQFEVLRRMQLEIDPSRIAVNDDGTTACVTGCWSRAIQLVTLADESPTLKTVSLEFEPQEVLHIEKNKFLVADAFGGEMAVIKSDGKIVTEQRLHGHQIRGLAISKEEKQVLVTHQRLSRIARSDFDDVHWGSLIQNTVSKIPFSSIVNDSVFFRESIRKVQLGDTGQGFGDPAGVVALPDGFAVLSGGARQLVVHKAGEESRRVDVGARPTKLISLSSDRLVALNEHDASLTVVSLDSGDSQTVELSSGAKVVTSGEEAFYDASLSHDSWMSCNSCHVDGHTPALLADTFGDGDFDNPKRIPSLFGAHATAPYGWLGNKHDLHEQIRATMQTTMQVPQPSDDVVNDLVAFVSSMPALPANQKNTGLVQQGRKLFEKHKCVDCHASPTFTSARVLDVGLSDEVGTQKFNPPSLRGLRFRRRFFHDARATTLQDVFSEYHHPAKTEFTADQIRQLLAYLQTL